MRRTPAGGAEALLYNFQLGCAPEQVGGTAHPSALLSQPALVYQAPRSGSPGSAQVEADLFSLGALGPS